MADNSSQDLWGGGGLLRNNNPQLVLLGLGYRPSLAIALVEEQLRADLGMAWVPSLEIAEQKGAQLLE